MNTPGFARIKTLNRENDAWEYVSGECAKPTLEADNEASEEAVKSWSKNDSKAVSDIILSIKPSELKLIKGCTTSREIWLKLKDTYQSKGPAQKATLLKQLTLQRMEEGEDILHT
jgi:hypothetical protein